MFSGKPPPPLFPIPTEEEDDTPRTYRSEGDPPPQPKKKKSGKVQEEEEPEILEREEAIGMLRKTFGFFQRAVVSQQLLPKIYPKIIIKTFATAIFRKK